MDDKDNKSAKSLLKEDFKRACEEAKIKLDTAAKLLSAANDQLLQFGITIGGYDQNFPVSLTDEETDEFYSMANDFLDAVNDAGWTASSMNC